VMGRRRKSAHANVVWVSLETRLDQAEGDYRKRIDSTQHAGRKKDRVLSTLDKRSNRAGIFPSRESPGQRARRRASGFRPCRLAYRRAAIKQRQSARLSRGTPTGGWKQGSGTTQECRRW